MDGDRASAGPSDLMGGVVVRDDVDLFAAVDASVDQPKELQPFTVTVSPHAGRQNRAVEGVECREQRRCSMTFVVVRHGSCPPLLHGQTGLGAV